ncbi:efflux RND transporter periplasmic adaptor subunit [Mucisphaera calidilacus]|uniref:efflux RND transporter periplasmic adaptor subunit n=1 Tax=Mucisphaera calidilacus TaxID=2527982 RepID=UPI001F24290A|nr:efflux RND transporter periplasmic adaptor subunit [Mucisphaera calidilacus]
MFRSRHLIPLILTGILLAAAALFFLPNNVGPADQSPGGDGPALAVPVEVARIQRGSIELRRTFTGSLEARSTMAVAAKISGRVASIEVDLADPVTNGAEVVILDDDEEQQALVQAEAELAVAEAGLTEARDALEIAERKMQRQTLLRERGVASEAQMDTVRAEQLAARSRVAVAEAQRERARATLQTARIRLGYTRVMAAWEAGDDRRVVAQRYVEQGDTVAANTTLLTIVELDPIKAVVFVTERDYARLRPGQHVTISTDSYEDRVFTGKVARVSPVFESSSRQARVELLVPNPGRLLKPGMFVRAETILDAAQDATIVPSGALVRRADRPVLFLLDEQAMRVRMSPVETGIESGGRVQILTSDLSGRVVTLGHQLLDDGSSVTVPADEKPVTPPEDPTGS